MTRKAFRSSLEKPTTISNVENEPIAMIGIGCHFPGGVDNPQTFWQLLVNGIDAITEIPADRVDVAPHYDPVLAAPGKIASNQGGFLEKIELFDASFFGVAPREANYMDPQQRLLLATTWEALEDAGQIPESLNESQTGVFIGMWANDYTEKMYKATEDINLYITTGGGRYAASGRLSYFFGFQGPSLTVDTACSSSLVTVHLACQSLRKGETNLALAGGVNLILEPSISIGYSRSKMLSPDGRCKFGDVGANGYVRSEGVGIVVLKRLSQALADGDHIYAVIRGSAVNNDGRSSELLVAPGVGSQIKMLREAYRDAGVDPCQVGYVEAHGTGTPIGDPVELEAIGTVLSENREVTRPLRVGSIKTNIGHTEAASGVAGLIKTALILEHKAIPPSLHFKDPNPRILWKDLRLEMQTELTPWPDSGEPAIAGVNSFGITGTNAHIVIEEAPRVGNESSKNESETDYLLPLSAQTPEALQDLVQSYLPFLSKANTDAIHSICYTASCRRTQHAHRLTVVGKSAHELAEKLSLYQQQKTKDGAVQTKIDKRAKVVFVFPGQGAQWLGMGRQLLIQNSVFSDVLTQCDHAIRHWADWSLLEQLALQEDSSAYRLNEISVIQPTLFAMEVALAEVWRSWGIEPAAVIGHSMGEVAASYIAGALTLDDAAHVICKRSQLMQRTSGHGAMAVIGLPSREVGQRLQGYEGRLSIAVQNSPKSTVVSGDPAALELLMEDLRQHEIFCHLIKVDVASHSPQMDPIQPELVKSLSGIQPQATTIPFYSTVTQDAYDGESLNAEYWGSNLRQPVRFSETVQRLLENKHNIFIEMSPHPILLSSIEEIRGEMGKPAYSFASTRRDQSELSSLLHELGALYMLGYQIDWNKLYPEGGEIVSLPTYPWQRERYWFETTVSTKQTRPGAHPLLGQYVHVATGEHVWETTLSTKNFPYLNDHRVRGSAVFPAAGYVEMTLAAASEVYGIKPYRLNEISFQEALFLSDEKDHVIQLVMTADTSDAAEFQVFSRTAQSDAAASWTLHASGKIEVIQEPSPHENISLKSLSLHAKSELTAEQFYRSAFQRGLEYGATFQTIRQLALPQGGILSKIKLSDALVANATKYELHPALLDACFQTLLWAVPKSNQDTYLPVALGNIQVHAKPKFGDELWCYCIASVAGDKTLGKLYLFNGDGQMVMFANELCLQRVESKQEVQSLLYEIQWHESPIPYHEQEEAKHWLIFADQQGVGKSLAERLQKDSQSCTLVFKGNSYRSITAKHYELNPLEPADFQRLLKEIAPVQGIVHFWTLDSGPEPSASDPGLLSILYLTRAIGYLNNSEALRVWLLTRGTQTVHAQPEPISISQSAVWGMGAVITNEFPNVHCTRIDLSPVILDDEIELLTYSLQVQDEEDQVALRNRQRYVARLKEAQLSVANEGQSSTKQRREDDQPFQAQITTPGILDGLSLKPVIRKSPKSGEVEIAVKATGLNFMNVMSGMGMYPGYPNGVGPLGIECSGVISRIGEGVTDFHIGEAVTGIAFDSLASHAITDARLIVKKPTSMSFEEAACIPIAYLTAYYAMHDLGRMQFGERVLIHSATGGVGLAAIQLAQRAGAQIFATAGSEEKRNYLRKMGITHIMDSRTLAFAADIMNITGGEGVDLVLNSLTGSAIAKGLEILKPYGRFLEIGKRDIYGDSKIGLLPFQKNLSYFAIDLDKMSRERPEIVGKMLREVFALIEAREIPPLPVQTFPISKASDGFRMMAQAKHIGKIAILVEDPEASFELHVGATPIRADGTYLITGGLGDLGLTMAQWLARQGVHHLVLLGRSKPTPAAQKVIVELQAAYVNVVTVQADVADLDQLEKAFVQIKETLPPLRGIIHAAGLLADGTILQMEPEQFMQAYAPKALGAWNLHMLTADQPLEFFILFSSVAAILGTPGQVNYAAGNAFLDALARFRRAQNRPALSINWGPWSEIGLAAMQQNRGERLAREGLMSITQTQGLEAMDQIMAHKTAQIAVMSFNAQNWCASHPGATRSAFFTHLGTPATGKILEPKSQPQLRDILLGTESLKQRRALFEGHVREQVAQVLRMAPTRLPVDKPLKALGLDSLMSIELRNRLEDTLGVPLAATVVWNYPTLNSLTTFLASKMNIPLEPANLTYDAAQGMPRPGTVNENTHTTDIDQLSTAELDALLLEELNTMKDLLRGNKNE